MKKICTLKASSSKRSETGLLINKGCKRALGAFAPTEVSFTWKPATGLKVAHGGRTGGRENSPLNPQLPTALPPQRGLKKWTKRKSFSMLLSRFKGLARLLVSCRVENASGRAVYTSGCPESRLRCGLCSGCDVGSKARGSGGASACSLVARQGLSYSAAHGILAPHPGIHPAYPLPRDAESQSLDHQRSFPLVCFLIKELVGGKWVEFFICHFDCRFLDQYLPFLYLVRSNSSRH